MRDRVSNWEKENIKHTDAKAHKVVEALELPKDILLGLPMLSLEGNRAVYITNHRGLISYDQEQIVVAAKNGTIRIHGRKLVIPQFTGDIIEIRGYLEGVSFL